MFGVVGTVAAGCAAPAAVGAGAAPRPEVLTLYSPAKPPNPLWAKNAELGARLQACGVAGRVEVVPTALPESVLDTRGLADKGAHLPITTTVDFLPSVAGTGPDWHAYPDANPDLKMVAPLYDVGIGVQVFDASITSPGDLRGRALAVPRRPSSLRVVAEAILFDAWGLEGDVELIDMPPDKVGQAVASGQVAGTTWNMMIETDGAYAPMLGELRGPEDDARWLSVGMDDIARINAAGDYVVSPTAFNSGVTATAVSFRQGLAAWDATDPALVRAIAECVGVSPTLWPGLEAAELHPALQTEYTSN